MKCHCKDNLCFGSVSFLSVSTLMTPQAVLPANCCTRTAFFKYHHYFALNRLLDRTEPCDSYLAQLLLCLEMQQQLWCHHIPHRRHFESHLQASGTLCRQERTRTREQAGWFYILSLSSRCECTSNAFMCSAGIKKYVVGLIIKTSSDASVVEVSQSLMDFRSVLSVLSVLSLLSVRSVLSVRSGIILSCLCKFLHSVFLIWLCVSKWMTPPAPPTLEMRVRKCNYYYFTNVFLLWVKSPTGSTHWLICQMKTSVLPWLLAVFHFAFDLLWCAFLINVFFLYQQKEKVYIGKLNMILVQASSPRC